MATELDHGYCGWPHEELLIQEDSQVFTSSVLMFCGYNFCILFSGFIC